MGEHALEPSVAGFYGLMVVERRLSERLDAALEAAAGVSLSRLELLLHLHWSEGRRRMSELAEDLVLSRGGATRLVARAEEAGLVRREIPPDDRRATYAVLTEAGIEAAERGFPVYVETVRRLFQDYVSDAEAETLIRVWHRVLDGNGLACGPITKAAAALDEREQAA